MEVEGVETSVGFGWRVYGKGWKRVWGAERGGNECGGWKERGVWEWKGVGVSGECEGLDIRGVEGMGWISSQNE